MAASVFTLSILSPEKSFYSGEASEVIFTTPEGRLGVMAGHSPLVASVSNGIMEILIGDEWKIAAVGSGFCEIAYYNADFYVDTAEWADEIDAIRAKESLERAELRIRSHLSNKEYMRTQAAISRALTRLKAVDVTVK